MQDDMQDDTQDNVQYDYDVLIVGGGLVGNSLVLALQNSGLRLALVEASSQQQLQNSPAGNRALALSAGTIKLLQALEAWDGIKSQTTAINHIHISDKGHFGKVRLSAKKERVESLGCVISAKNIEGHLASLVKQTGIKQIRPSYVVGLVATTDAIKVKLQQHNKTSNLTVKLIIGADGGQSTVRHLLGIPQQRINYHQSALVTTVKSSLPHKNTAFERFTASGPLAILPINKTECSVVWTRTQQEAKDLMASSKAVFLTQLQQCFGYTLGTLTLSAPRKALPLSLIRAQSMVAKRAVIVGNAVHQLHPVAGQGFNLGIRDVAQLAEMLLAQHQKKVDIGASDFLQRYATIRKKDHDFTIGFTNGLVNIFSTDWLPLAIARSISLTALDHIPMAKSLLAKHAMGLAGRLPRIGYRR